MILWRYFLMITDENPHLHITLLGPSKLGTSHLAVLQVKDEFVSLYSITFNDSSQRMTSQIGLLDYEVGYEVEQAFRIV